MPASHLVNLSGLMDDAKCFTFVRQHRWPDGVQCPGCSSPAVVRDGCDDAQPARQRYRCKACGSRFDDLTGTVLAGHHQPLRVWVLCLYFMGLNLSNRQIAKELGLAASDVQAMTEQLRRGLAAKAPAVELKGEVEIDEVYVVAGHKGQPAAVAKRGGSDGAASWQTRRAGTLEKDRPPILGLIQRGDQVVLCMLANVQQATIKPVITAAVAPGALAHTDECSIYARLPAWGYGHKTVCHARGERARNEDGQLRPAPPGVLRLLHAGRACLLHVPDQAAVAAAGARRAASRLVPWISWSGATCAGCFPRPRRSRTRCSARGGHWLPQELQARRANLCRSRAALGQQVERLTDACLAAVVPMAECQRRWRDTEARLQALNRQEAELTHDAKRQGETASLAARAEAFCCCARNGLAAADFAQKLALLEPLVDRVVVADGAVEIRYVVPTGPDSEREPFCRLSSDYRDSHVQMQTPDRPQAARPEPACATGPGRHPRRSAEGGDPNGKARLRPCCLNAALDGAAQPRGDPCTNAYACAISTDRMTVVF